MMWQGAAQKAEAAKKEAAKKEIAELMAKAKADMEAQDNKEDATAAQGQADDLQKEVCCHPFVCLASSRSRAKPVCLGWPESSTTTA